MTTSTRNRSAFRRVAGTLAALLTVGFVAPSAPAPVSAAGVQRTLFNHSGQQDAGEYFQPTLNQPSNYNSPNIAGGRTLIKMVVTSKPSTKAMWPQLCFWRHASSNYQYETCSPYLMDLKTPGTYYIDAGAATSWWKKNGTFSWSSPVSVGRIMMKDPITKSLFLSSRCGGACYKGSEGVDPHVPVQFSAETVMVGAGSAFTPPSSWRATCPAAWSSLCSGGPATPRGTEGGGDTTPPPPGTPTTTPPPASAYVPVIGLSAGSNSLTASWPAVSGASLYQMRHRAAGASFTWDTPASNRSRVIGSLSAGTSYEVQVRSFADGAWRDWGSVSGTPTAVAPPPPTTTTQPPTTTTQPPTTTTQPSTTTTQPPATTGYLPAIRLSAGAESLEASWSSVSSASLYQLKYREVGKSFKWDAPANTQSRVLGGLSAGSDYDVYVRAYADGEWRPWSSVTGTPTASTPATPSSPLQTVVSISPTVNGLSVTWTEVPGAALYQLRYQEIGGRKTWNAPSADRGASIGGLISGKTYRVEVRAYTQGAWQNWSEATASAS